MIENLSKSWRLWSVQLAAILGIIAAFEPHWPALSKALPPHWVEIGAALIVIARILRQGPPPPPSSPDGLSGPSANGPGDSSPPSLSSLGFAGVVCFCVIGCQPTAPKFTDSQEACRNEARKAYGIEFAVCEAKDTVKPGSCEELDRIEYEYCVALVTCAGGTEADCDD